MTREATHPGRVHALRTGTPDGRGPVVYWMSRDQRADDNWALLHACHEARRLGCGVRVAFCLAPGFPGANLRHYHFMLRGLAEAEARLARAGIPFTLLMGPPGETLPEFLRTAQARLLVTDFDPLRVKRGWVAEVLAATSLPAMEVDAHNVVPCRAASAKREYAARTIRPKIHRLLPEFLSPFPALAAPRPGVALDQPTDWDAALAFVNPDPSVAPVEGFTPGTCAGMDALGRFCAEGIHRYAAERNDPNADAQSGLSPWLHFGQISAQRAALAALAALDSGAERENVDAFLEELIIRRELSDNFCLHEPAYDSLDGADAWAKATLEAHRGDRRAYVYDLEAFDKGATHSALWNAAQHELRRSGKLHGYMRMYWAKKILEWSAGPEEAVGMALTLNDRWALDGRDPNGFVGVLWSIAGVHDRAWTERPVYGKIRYMNERGCRRKFDVERYIRRWSQAGLP
jgi:deoxyribodipyrimidine photo-lyase